MSVEQKSYLPGFEYLRVLCMCMVLYTHNEIASKYMNQYLNSISSSPHWMDVVCYQLRTIAVPIFTLISMILFVSKDRSKQELKARIVNLAYIFLFWSFIGIMTSRARPKEGIFEWFQFFYTGGYSEYYFINNLIVCTILSYWASKMTRKLTIVLFVISIILCFSMFLWFASGYYWLYMRGAWTPTAFIMMPFAAVLLKPYVLGSHAASSAKYRIVLILGLLTVVFAFIEWRFHAPFELIGEYRQWLPWHSRLSNHFLAMIVVILASGVRRKSGKLIRYLSKNSLGVYCSHWIIMWNIVYASDRYLTHISPFLSFAVSYLAVFAICLIFTEFLRRALQHRLV
jgi:peptidoglycan/LPS O-acetylase OafA/YrhL